MEESKVLDNIELMESWLNGNISATREAISKMTPGETYEFISTCADNGIEQEQLERLFNAGEGIK